MHLSPVHFLRAARTSEAPSWPCWDPLPQVSRRAQGNLGSRVQVLPIPPLWASLESGDAAPGEGHRKYEEGLSQTGAFREALPRAIGTDNFPPFSLFGISGVLILRSSDLTLYVVNIPPGMSRRHIKSQIKIRRFPRRKCDSDNEHKP